MKNFNYILFAGALLLGAYALESSEVTSSGEKAAITSEEIAAKKQSKEQAPAVEKKEANTTADAGATSTEKKCECKKPASPVVKK